jgi:hypothetical protein
LARPASFQLPDKKSTLTLGNSTYETLASLRGAKVKCKRTNSEVEGTIFNTDTLQEVGQNGQVVHTPYLTIQTKDGLETLPWREITKLVFTENEIKGEIEKALAANRQKLKPDAVFLNVALATKPDDPQNDKDELALLQWVEQPQGTQGRHTGLTKTDLERAAAALRILDAYAKFGLALIRGKDPIRPPLRTKVPG